jgi:hypothetical protein
MRRESGSYIRKTWKPQDQSKPEVPSVQASVPGDIASMELVTCWAVPEGVIIAWVH